MKLLVGRKGPSGFYGDPQPTLVLLVFPLVLCTLLSDVRGLERLKGSQEPLRYVWSRISSLCLVLRTVRPRVFMADN